MIDISFVVPHYKKPEKVLYKTLKSLFEQSVKNIEVILVLDGPDEDARRVAKRFKKEPLKVIEIEHGGACAARNAGREVATGKYISFWDADCYIEPGAAAVWLQAFDKYPDVDFVYSGYRFTEGYGAMPSEEFDPWLLRVNNYISGLFPIKRDKCPKWDPAIKSLQDWDFWLTAVENGSKGLYLRGYAFITEPPDSNSISGQGCTPEKWLERLNAVKRKHNIPAKDMCVSAMDHRDYGKQLAKLLDADYRDIPTHIAHEYKTILSVGFNPQRAVEHSQVFKDHVGLVKKILFWTGDDVAYMRKLMSGEQVESLIMLLNKQVQFHFCEDRGTQQLLKKIGVEAKVKPLPMEAPKDIAPLPEKVRFLVDIESEYNDFFDSIMRACPDIEFVKFQGAKNVDHFHGMIQFLHDRSVGIPSKKALLDGRYLISNVQALYCGYVSDAQPLEAMRAEVIRKVREVQAKKEPNLGAANHYSVECSPETFKATLAQMTETKELAEVA